MKTPDKVVLEITPDGFSQTIYAGKKVVSQRTSTMERAGLMEGNQKGDVMDDLAKMDVEDLAEAIDSMNMDVFEVVSELHSLHR